MIKTKGTSMTIRSEFSIFAAMLLLVGCATWGQFDEGLHGLVDLPLSNAISKLGYPSGERTVAGMRLVEWGRAQQGYAAMPITGNAYGTLNTPAGYGTYSATTTATSLVPVQYNCSITLKVDQNDTVRGYQYDGNLGGCEGYIQALKK